MSQTDNREFKCAQCGGEFESDPEFSEEDAMREYEELFPKSSPEEIVSVCDDCWQELMRQ